MQSFQRGGMSPLQALMTATTEPARHLGLSRDLGTIEAGKLADLVIMEKDPLADIANAESLTHVMIGGRTIGNAASGGTERANADTEALFIGLWNNYLNADLPIQDSSGEATTRGANAAADYAANKRLPTLDGRGRVIAGLDNMGGTPAGRLSGQTDGVNGLKMGASGGKELHTLTEPQLPAVTTTLRYGNGFNGAANPSGNGAFITNVSNNDSPNDTTIINSFGGNNPHNNVQPTLILPYIMKL
jgi:hypothetical protein